MYRRCHVVEVEKKKTVSHQTMELSDFNIVLCYLSTSPIFVDFRSVILASSLCICYN